MKIFTWIFCTLLVVVVSTKKNQPQHGFNTALTGNQTLLLKGYYCSSDSECALRLYCHAPGHAHSQCTPCKRRVRRCNRDRMCCPGNRCRKRMCIKASRRASSRHRAESHCNNKLPQSTTRTRPNKPRRGELGAKCVRSKDCGRGLCCARHLWRRVCKAESQEGAVCSAPWRRKPPHSTTPELFQLCSCSHGLICRAQNITHTHAHTHQHTPAHSHTYTHQHTSAHTHTYPNTHTPTHSHTRLHTCQRL